MAEYPYMPLWVGDYLRDTRHLGAREHGAYLLLLMEAWRRPSCSLPDDDALLARWASVTPDEWAEIKPIVMAFWRIDGRKKEWANSKLSRVRVQARESSKKQAGRAASGWEKRKKIPAAAMPGQSRGNANTQSSKVEKEKATPSPKKGTRLPADWFLPREWGEWALGEGMDHETIRREAEKFRDHFHSTTRNATKLDWLKAWRNWCRTAMERRPQQRSSSRGQQRFDRRMEFARSLEERQAAESDMADGAGDGSVVTLLPARHIG